MKLLLLTFLLLIAGCGHSIQIVAPPVTSYPNRESIKPKVDLSALPDGMVESDETEHDGLRGTKRVIHLTSSDFRIIVVPIKGDPGTERRGWLENAIDR